MERLNKFLAHAGIGSRRHCDDLIQNGRVSIDGKPVHEMGTRVDPKTHQVCVDGQPVQSEPLVYWLVNKPRGYLCTNHDPAGRPRAIDLITHVNQRVYTVGRLDEDSEGLLLMTNDGDLAFQLMHPRYGVAKTYLVQVVGKPSNEDLDKLLAGVYLSDGHVKAKRVKRLRIQGESTWLEIVLNEGKNREIRRMLAQLDHKVLRLQRVRIGPLRLDRLPKGKSRRLVPDEVNELRAAMDRRSKKDSAEAADFEREAPLPPRPPRPTRAPRPAQDRRGGILDPRPPRKTEARPYQAEGPMPRPQHPLARPQGQPPRPEGAPRNRRPLTDRASKRGPRQP